MPEASAGETEINGWMVREGLAVAYTSYSVRYLPADTIARRDSRVSAYLRDVDLEDRSDWLRQHEWLAKRLNDMHRVFSGRVKSLELQAWDPAEQTAAAE